MSLRRLYPLLALLSLAVIVPALLACDSDTADDGAARQPLVASSPTAAAPVDTPAPAPPSLTVSVQLSDPVERDQMVTLLEAMTLPDGTQVSVSTAATDAAANSDFELSDRPTEGGTAYVVEAWAAVVHQRADVFELSLDQLRGVLAGRVDDWSAIGGASRPLRVFSATGGKDALASSLDLTGEAFAASGETVDAVFAAVESDRDVVAIVPASALRPGVLALVVDGHDPYRDAWAESPLAVRRWLRGSDATVLEALATRLGLDGLADAALDPVGVVASGELIPARCSDAVLAEVGDFGAMFDGTRHVLAAADLLVVPLEVSLTDLSPPTPCTRTFVLQGRPEALDAIAALGVDMVLTAGNHAMDCWEPCPGGSGLLDTLRRFDEAGVAHAGAAADLAGARTPVVVERGGLSFAFLAYDSIALYYAAEVGAPGTAPLDLATLGDDVRAAAELADHVIVGFGWGTEYTADPTAFQRDAAAIAVEAGATLIIGNHPHWVQAVELLDGALVAYSLGNFVFDQDWSVPTTQGMTLEAGFSEQGLLGFRLRPVVIRGDREHFRGLYRPEFVDPATEGAPILRRVWDAADRLPAR